MRRARLKEMFQYVYRKKSAKKELESRQHGMMVRQQTMHDSQGGVGAMLDESVAPPPPPTPKKKARAHPFA
jgi:hypothetical protein